MHPYVYGPKFMWNLDCSVGKGGANSIASDVSFIQWYYTHAAGFHLTEPGNKEIYRKVKITGTCNGTDNDPLVAAIFAQQRSMNHPFVDGKVNVVTGPGKGWRKRILRPAARGALRDHVSECLAETGSNSKLPRQCSGGVARRRTKPG